MELPFFKYHPEPLKTGIIKTSSNTCIVCDQARGYIYSGPVYAKGEYADSICPWCIADGSAHEKLQAQFTDLSGIGNCLACEGAVAEEIEEEVGYRTPGFYGWQQERWFTHCDDAAAFRGEVGYEELETIGPDAMEALQEDTGLSDEDWEDYVIDLDRKGSPRGYLFQCLHCGAYGGYIDCD